MNIHSIQQSIIGWGSALRRATGLKAAGPVLCVLLSGQAHAQYAVSPTGSTQNRSAVSTAGGLYTHGDQSYRVVSAADYTTSTVITQAAANTIAQAGCFLGGGGCDSSCDAACSSCDGMGYQVGCGGACGGSCNACGGYGGMSGGYGGTSCPTCQSYLYATVESLYMRRTGSRRFSASPDFFLTGFDYDWAPRLTIGSVPDCVRGYELSYTGQFDWDRVGVQTDPAGGLGTLLFAVPPVTPAGLSAFDNATAQAQFYTAEYWSLEASSTMVGWEVAKLLIGVRYIDYDENFSIFSQNATEVGFLRSDIQNQMLGLQVGMDLLYPICRRTYTDLRARAGVYANFVDLDFQVINAGTTTALVLDESTELAGQFEFGSGIRYEFCEQFSIRAGYELWYFTGIASAKDQFSGGIVSQRTVRAKDDFLAVGVNVGAVFRY